MGAWSRPAGDVPTDRSPAATGARAARRCPNRGAPGASDTWAPIDDGRERERRGAGRMGRPGEKGEWAEPEETGGFFIYSNRIQTSSNIFDQKVDLPRSKNSK
jgi:hypothetical protein